jgi:hypothetical protein
MTLAHDLKSRFLKLSLVSQVVVGVLGLSLVVLVAAYFLGGFEGLTESGAGALIFGVIASFAVGVGLMATIFYSSRFYDEAAHYAAMDEFEEKPASPEDSQERPIESDTDSSSTQEELPPRTGS